MRQVLPLSTPLSRPTVTSIGRRKVASLPHWNASTPSVRSSQAGNRDQMAATQTPVQGAAPPNSNSPACTRWGGSNNKGGPSNEPPCPAPFEVLGSHRAAGRLWDHGPSARPSARSRPSPHKSAQSGNRACTFETDKTSEGLLSPNPKSARPPARPAPARRPHLGFPGIKGCARVLVVQ